MIFCREKSLILLGRRILVLGYMDMVEERVIFFFVEDIDLGYGVV